MDFNDIKNTWKDSFKDNGLLNKEEIEGKLRIKSKSSTALKKVKRNYLFEIIGGGSVFLYFITWLFINLTKYKFVIIAVCILFFGLILSFAWRNYNKVRKTVISTDQLKPALKKTIKDVLDWLEFQQMVTVVSNGKGTFISVTNWDAYQSKELDKVTAQSNDVDHEHKRLLETIKELNKKLKEKNKKEYKEKITKPDFFTVEQWKKLLKIRKAKKVLNTSDALKPFVNKIKEAVDKKYSVDECLDEYASGNWKRFDVSWMPEPKEDSKWR